MAICSGRFGTGKTYAVDEMLTDVKKGVWSELLTHKEIDMYKRNLQKVYVEALINILNPTATVSLQNLPPQFAALFNTNVKNTDIPSVVRAHLTGLRADILANLPAISDKLTKYHLQDIAERIRKALDPK